MKFSPWIPLSAFQGRSHNWQKVGAGAKNGEGLGPEPELTTGQGRNLKAGARARADKMCTL